MVQERWGSVLMTGVLRQRHCGCLLRLSRRARERFLSRGAENAMRFLIPFERSGHLEELEYQKKLKPVSCEIVSNGTVSRVTFRRSSSVLRTTDIQFHPFSLVDIHPLGCSCGIHLVKWSQNRYPALSVSSLLYCNRIHSEWLVILVSLCSGSSSFSLWRGPLLSLQASFGSSSSLLKASLDSSRTPTTVWKDMSLGLARLAMPLSTATLAVPLPK